MTQLTRTAGFQNRLTTFFGVSIQIMTILFLARLTVDTGIRSLYPFIPQLSAGLGLSVFGFSQLIFIRSIAGVTGPVFGVLTDRYGRRKLMAVGLLFQAVGVTGLVFSQQWWATLPMIIFGLSLAAFIPAQQSYISDQVAYEKRGRALAAIEFAWAVAGIVSLPLIGWMIDRFGWRSPFLLLALFSLASAIMTWIQLPSVEQRSHITLTPGMILALARRPNILASVVISILLFISVGNFITIWGIWLSADFDLAATALGLVATAVGLAELGGSGLSSLFIDRIGKRRGSLISLGLTATAFLILPLTQFNLWIAILGLVLLGVLIEFSVVSLIPLYSEQAPEARATTFSMTALGAAVGGAVGSPLTAILWERSGLWAVSLVSTFCLIIAAMLLFRFLKEH